MAVAGKFKTKRRKGVKVKRVSKSKPNCVTTRLPGTKSDEIDVVCNTKGDLEKFKKTTLPRLKGDADADGKRAEKPAKKRKAKKGAKKAAKKRKAKKTAPKKAAAKKAPKRKAKKGAKRAAKSAKSKKSRKSKSKSLC